MARILCVSSDLPGIVYANVEIARRLAVAGHEVTFACEPDAGELAAHHGLDFMRLPTGRYDEFVRVDARSGWLGRLRNLRERRRRAVESTGAHEFVRAVRELAPDLLIIDGELHEQIIASSAIGIPMALSNTLLSIWRRPGLPPAHHLVRPGVGWWGSRPGMALLWLLLSARKSQRAWRQWVRRVGCDRVSILRRLANEAGFDFRGETDRGQWLIPFTYRRIPVLHARAREFDFTHRPFDHVHFVGPMVLESRIDRRPDEAVARQLEAIYERRRRSNGRCKLIYAGFGAFFSTGIPLLRRLVEAVAGRDDRELVVSLGRQSEPADLGPLPDNVHAFAWLPQLDVLRHTDLAVNHGGINTIDECILHGVPMLVYRGFATDMGGSTARVVHHGLGLAGDPVRDDVATIRTRMDRVLEEPGFAASVEAMRRSYAGYTAGRVVEKVVESMLER